MSFFAQSLQLGSVQLANRVFLAPLAGVSDVPFRRICQEQGAGLTYVEMLSATAILYKNRRTFEMMARHPTESLLGVQVTGPSADQVGRAIEILDSQGFETIDINMGCPVKKVVGAGCGSAILKEPARVSETVQSARAATRRPLSAKYRLGYTRENVNVAETTRRVTECEVDMFTIHGRTRSESYDTPVDLQGIALGVAAQAPAAGGRRALAIGNGDIFDFASAKRMQEATGCDAVMVSRGALGNPWLFAEILAGRPVTPRFSEWFDLVMRHVSYHEEHYGKTRTSAVLIRKHLLWYCKGFPGTKQLREKFNTVEDLDVARSILMDYARTISPCFARFSGSANDGDVHKGERVDGGYDPKYEMDRKLDRGVGDEEMAAATENA